MRKHVNNNIAGVLKALGDDTRYQIIRLLLGSELCVGALARILNISKPAVSQHLKILREAGLVKGEKRGYWTHYLVEKEALRGVAQNIRKLSEGFEQAGEDPFFSCLRQHGVPAGAISEPDSGSERRVLQMCEKCCEQPEKLKTQPEECTPEQKKECHGEMEEHPCECGCDEKKKKGGE